MELIDAQEAIVLEKNSGLLYSRPFAFVNIFVSVAILALTINGIILDSLSHYDGQTEFTFTGIFRTETAGYFDCGWGIYEAHFEKDDGELYESGEQTWYYGHTECVRLTNSKSLSLGSVQYTCDWYQTPNESGLIWCICNIVGCMPIFMTLLLYIFSLFPNTISTALYHHRRIFKITFYLSLCSGCAIAFAIVYWFYVNGKGNGCWRDEYEYIIDFDILSAGDSSLSNDNFEWYQFDKKAMGDSMICDIVAASLIWMLVFFYFFVSCGCCTMCGMEEQYEEKTHRHSVEMLAQQDAQENVNVKGYSELDGEYTE